MFFFFTVYFYVPCISWLLHTVTFHHYSIAERNTKFTIQTLSFSDNNMTWAHLEIISKIIMKRN